MRLWRKAFLSKSGSSDADVDEAPEGGDASQRTEEGARRRAAAGEKSAVPERSCVVMVAIAGRGEALGGGAEGCVAGGEH